MRERESLHQSNPYFVLFRYFKIIIIIITKTEKETNNAFLSGADKHDALFDKRRLFHTQSQ